MDVLINSEVDTLLCFDFNIDSLEDAHLQKMEAYMHGKEVSQQSPLQPWYKTQSVVLTLRQQFHRFKAFVEANQGRKDVEYVVTNGDSEAAAQSGKVAVISLYQNGCPTEFELPDQPGKPHASDVTHDSLQLMWDKPKYGVTSVQFYTVSYRSVEDQPDQWYTIQSAEQSVKFSAVAPKTKYYFKVSAETAAGISPESDLSDPIETKPSPDVGLGAKILPSCTPIGVESNPSIYQLPTYDVVRKKDVAKVCIGTLPKTPSATVSQHRVLMVVGATGAGKSTLINGIANYIMGVRWEDEFRFKLINEKSAHDQSKSQTKCITAYTFQQEVGSPLPYTLTVIDTPGFGDTEGLERDEKITSQIKEFFRSSDGIDQLHAIGFVTSASQARLTPTQRYIFDAILSIFGKDIGSNIFLMTTFADGQRPPVIDAVQAAKVPFQNHFKFNNSALFAGKSASDKFDALFWDMGVSSFHDFFVHFSQVEPRSLQLTKEVLKEREHLEVTIQGLQPQIRAGLAERDRLDQTEKQLNQHKADIHANKNFKIPVTVTKLETVKVPNGLFTTTCLNCHFTCHEICAIPDDGDKYCCAAMSDGTKENITCTVCPQKCSWELHKNTPFKYVLRQVEETQTLEEIKALYQSAVSGKNEVEAVIEEIKKKMVEIDDQVDSMIDQARYSLERLHEIALKPNPLTQVDYIDILIESEKQQALPGWKGRVMSLQQARSKAEMVDKLAKNETDAFYASGKPRPPTEKKPTKGWVKKYVPSSCQKYIPSWLSKSE